MKAFISGITGLAGSYLAELLINKGHKVFGIDNNINKHNIKSIVNKMKLQKCDIKNKKMLTKIIGEIKPDFIFHLAGITYNSFRKNFLENMYKTNILGMINVFEAERINSINPLILVTCSSSEYGLGASKKNPIQEENNLNPCTPYGVSKLAQDMIAFQYYQNYNLRIIRTRTFNNTAPRENPFFVCSDFAKQIAEIEKGYKRPILCVGNTKSVRDFTDTRDIVKAYYLVLRKGQVGGVYNVCSGTGYSIGNILDILLGMSKVQIKVKQQRDKIQGYDVPLQIGDYSKLKKDAGWEPVTKMETTLRDILNYWRTVV